MRITEMDPGAVLARVDEFQRVYGRAFGAPGYDEPAEAAQRFRAEQLPRHAERAVKAPQAERGRHAWPARQAGQHVSGQIVGGLRRYPRSLLKILAHGPGGRRGEQPEQRPRAGSRENRRPAGRRDRRPSGREPVDRFD